MHSQISPANSTLMNYMPEINLQENFERSAQRERLKFKPPTRQPDLEQNE